MTLQAYTQSNSSPRYSTAGNVGKTSSAIRELIGRVGLPFAGPLMDRLAEETSMSGAAAHGMLQTIGRRLLMPSSSVFTTRAGTWCAISSYCCANSTHRPPPALASWSPTHPKVQPEVMRALCTSRSTCGRLLLQELDSKDPVVLLHAPAPAGSSNPTSPAAGRTTQRSDNAEPELPESTIIKTLAESAVPRCS